MLLKLKEIQRTSNINRKYVVSKKETLEKFPAYCQYYLLT